MVLVTSRKPTRTQRRTLSWNCRAIPTRIILLRVESPGLGRVHLGLPNESVLRNSGMVPAAASTSLSHFKRPSEKSSFKITSTSQHKEDNPTNHRPTQNKIRHDNGYKGVSHHNQDAAKH
eukprot:5017054-Amphidinium_carterae.1